MGSNMTRITSRFILTLSPLNLNSLGKRTACERLFENNFAIVSISYLLNDINRYVFMGKKNKNRIFILEGVKNIKKNPVKLGADVWTMCRVFLIF
jgi:hypothetical protein